MSTGAISLLIILVNVLVSYKGLTSNSFFDRYNFEVDKILVQKDYKRLITSGFLHVSWTHLIFNMLSLYFFSGTIGLFLGTANFLLVYFASLLGGNLFSLFVHRHHAGYSSVGASGAICGIIFACIALAPGMGIGFFFLPASIPGWIYGLIFVLYSIYGIRSKSDNVGHDAHLAGAVVGMIIALLIEPEAISENYTAVLAVLVPAMLFIYFIITRPHLLLIDNHFFKSEQKNYTLDQRYNAQKRNQQMEVDRILDKIHRRGMSSLSKSEKEVLDRYSKTVR
jgi:membrane associated rhomboid family serine protease